MEYFAIRNKDTQMWYRGKGVNRWGKYLNQASIYRVEGQAKFSLGELQTRKENVEIVTLYIYEKEKAFWVKPTPQSEPYCSNCGMGAHMLFGILPDFCPHCGVNMEEGVHESYEES